MLALDENVYSRFMIAPSRGNNPHPIACGLLGGFSGFLKRDFREHDFFLGRRNAQKFLRDRFVLPESNALFASWSSNDKDEYCVRNATSHEPITRQGKRLLPVIPLVGSAARETYEPTWPSYTKEDLNQLRL